jgi:hypothetical protein
MLDRFPSWKAKRTRAERTVTSLHDPQKKPFALQCHDGATPHLILLRDPATLFGGVGLTLLGQFMERRAG